MLLHAVTERLGRQEADVGRVQRPHQAGADALGHQRAAHLAEGFDLPRQLADRGGVDRAGFRRSACTPSRDPPGTAATRRPRRRCRPGAPAPTDRRCGSADHARCCGRTWRPPSCSPAGSTCRTRWRTGRAQRLRRSRCRTPQDALQRRACCCRRDCRAPPGWTTQTRPESRGRLASQHIAQARREIGIAGGEFGRILRPVHPGQMDHRIRAGDRIDQFGVAAGARDRQHLAAITLTQRHAQVLADEAVGAGDQDLHVNPPARPDARPPGHG